MVFEPSNAKEKIPINREGMVVDNATVNTVKYFGKKFLGKGLFPLPGFYAKGERK